MKKYSVKEREIKKLYDKLNKALSKAFSLRMEFDTQIVDHYGFHYSDRDTLGKADYIIDCVDYQSFYMGFKEFNDSMLDIDILWKEALS